MSIQSELTRIAGNVSDALEAIADKGVVVPAGSNSDDLADLIEQILVGAGSAITITDTLDANGGTIRTINAVSLAGDNVRANALLSGYQAHNALGELIIGTLAFASVYSGSSPPTAALGSDGDVYLEIL